jgi:homoserine dehydrogenase
MEHRIGLIGCGTVGQGLLQILHDKKDHLRDAYGFEAKPPSFLYTQQRFPSLCQQPSLKRLT